MNSHFNFEWEFRNFKIRTNHEDGHDSPINKNCPIELIKYFDDTHSTCYVVAWWEPDDEGYNLRFLGSRPFNDINPEEIASIWVQLTAAQKMLDEFFGACDKEEELEYW